jgi:hypothetical protein
MPKTLRFRARGEALVTHFERLDANIKSFVGRKFVRLGGPIPGPDDRFAFKPTGEVEEVLDRAEYRKACSDGDLWAADQETADACGVRFDPSFGAPPPAAPALSHESATSASSDS